RHVQRGRGRRAAALPVRAQGRAAGPAHALARVPAPGQRHAWRRAGRVLARATAADAPRPRGRHLGPGGGAGLAAQVHHGRRVRRLPAFARAEGTRRCALMSVPHEEHTASVVPISTAPSYQGEDGHETPDPVAELLAFLRRRLTGDYEVDEFGYDPELTDKVLLELLRPIYRHWFRVETLEIKDVPAEGGALVVANHAGTLPVDALMMQVALHDEAGRPLRLLGADLVYQLPVLSHLSRKTGHTLACREDAD